MFCIIRGCAERMPNFKMVLKRVCSSWVLQVDAYTGLLSSSASQNDALTCFAILGISKACLNVFSSSAVLQNDASMYFYHLGCVEMMLKHVACAKQKDAQTSFHHLDYFQMVLKRVFGGVGCGIPSVGPRGVATHFGQMAGALFDHWSQGRQARHLR